MRSWFEWWAIANLATEDEWRRWTDEVGFNDSQARDFTSHALPSFRRLYRLAQLVYPGAAALRALRLATEIQYNNKRGARAGYRALRAGLWHFGLLTATVPQL